MDDIFRSFFGFPNNYRGRRPPLDEDFDDYNDRDFRGGGGTFYFGGSPPSWSHHGDEDESGGIEIHIHDADEMFRHFEEMFKSMGMMEFPSMRPNMPGILLPPSGHGENDSSLRDEMLKIPDSHKQPGGSPHHENHTESHRHQPPSLPPSFFGNIAKIPQWKFRKSDDKRDIDLDEEVRKGNLDSILRNQQEDADTGVNQRPQAPRSHFHSQSVRVIRGADGKIEEHRTVTDGQGNKETTVTRRLGDQTYTVTTKQNSLGEQEKTENYTNIDQNNLDDFEKKWRGSGQKGVTFPSEDPRTDMILPDQDQQTKSIFNKLFGFSIPGIGKT